MVSWMLATEGRPVAGSPGQVSGGDLERVEAETQRTVAQRGAFRADQFRHRGV